MERQLCVMVHAIPHYLLIFLLMYVLNLLLLCQKTGEIIWLKCKNLNWDSAIYVHIRGMHYTFEFDKKNQLLSARSRKSK